MRKVILYGHPGCGHYRAAEDFLRQQGISFEEKNIQTDPKAYDELVHRWKSRAAVTLVIDGEVIIGWRTNRNHVEELLSADPLTCSGSC